MRLENTPTRGSICSAGEVCGNKKVSFTGKVIPINDLVSFDKADGLIGLVHQIDKKTHSCHLLNPLESFRESVISKMIIGAFKRKGDDSVEVTFNKFKNEPVKVYKEEFYDSKNSRLSIDASVKVWEIALRKLLPKKAPLKRVGKLFNIDPLNFYSAKRTMKYITGKKPINIGDFSLFRFNSKVRKKKKERAQFMLDKLSKLDNSQYSFVTGSNLFKTDDKVMLQKKHYFAIKDVNKEKQEITLFNSRYPKEPIKMSFDKYFKNFRSMVGYIWSDSALNVAEVAKREAV